ncbi:hypothetical protein ACFLTU_10975, partial [Bacteroidota bacterium]
MKDIVISGKRIRQELLILASCIGVAYLLNIISIIIFKTEWIELVSQLHVVIAFGIVIYILVVLLRLIFS